MTIMCHKSLDFSEFICHFPKIPRMTIKIVKLEVDGGPRKLSKNLFHGHEFD